MLQLKLNKTLH